MSPTNRTHWLLAAVLTLLWFYFVAVLLFSASIGGLEFGRTECLVLVLLGSAACFIATGRLSAERQKDLLAGGISLLFALVAADTAFTMWVNMQRPGDPSLDRTYERSSDLQIWHGEFYPRTYYPSDRSFILFKPNMRLEAVTYGEFYEQRMLKSTTLTTSVLRRRPLVYSIDRNGLRNRVPVEQSRIWALGDSFVFGFSTTEGLTWLDRLSELTGQAVYNLGISGTGPTQQVQLLDHVLRTQAGHAAPDHVLWMLFEGNDLENSSAERRPGPGRGAVWDNTLVGDLFELPHTIRERSMIGRLRDGALRFRRTGSSPGDDPYLVDGVPIATPLYRSQRWGASMFDPRDVEVATRDEAYVLSHPNRPALDGLFDHMKSLSREYGFRVTVTVAPSAPRMYGRDFPTMPQPSSEPHFIRYVESLARRMHFETIDLLGAMNPEHHDEMLYYRDDHHWNEMGNDVVARIVAAAF